MKYKEICKKIGLNKPVKSLKKEKKKMVCVKDKDKTKLIHYGAKGYEDFTMHKDKERRKRFRKRMGCDPVSELNKASAKFWACEDLW